MATTVYEREICCGVGEEVKHKNLISIKSRYASSFQRRDKEADILHVSPFVIRSDEGLALETSSSQRNRKVTTKD